MEIIDITVPLVEGEVTYPSLSPLRVDWKRRMDKGDPTSLSEVTLPCHLGTHLDAPGHILEGGALVGSTDLSRLIGVAEVIDVQDDLANNLTSRVSCDIGGAAAGDVSSAATGGVPAHRFISREFLEKRLGETSASIVLIRTGYRIPSESGGQFNSDYAHLDEEAAGYLVEKGVRTLGVDTPNVDRYGDRTYRIHKRLLRAGVVILEGLALSRVEPGTYGLVALPLALVSAEGAPVRAVLVRGVCGPGQ